MKAVARKKFTDKYTGEVYEAGSLMDITPDRYEEIRKTDANLVIAVADEAVAADQSTATDTKTAEGEKKPKKRTKKSAE